MESLDATGDGRRFERHAFVCTSDDSCGKLGGAALQSQLKALLKVSGRKESLRVNKSGCLGQCGHGPMMVVYPEGVWYSHLDAAGAERVWREHLVGGRPVEELRYRTSAAGTNVVSNAEGGLDGRPAERGPQSSPCSRCPT
ncbi:MAG: (2Fe-2S) ferredoxin domain-containing protein [Candidatus Thermoplasmatota archaeon]